jgi:putative copper resistance protein D
MIETGLIAARFLHFAAVMVLFGLALFPLYSYPSRVGTPPARLGRWLRASLQLTAFLALLSGMAWGVLTVADMTAAPSEALDAGTLWSALWETDFGRVWAARLALIAMLLALITGRISSARHTARPTDWVILLLSAAALLSLACVGHTQTDEGITRLAHMSADGAHLLAAGAWFGGLLALAYVLILARRLPSPEHTASAVTALARFANMGYVAVAVLVASGLVNTWLLVGSPAGLMGTAYGQLLLVKISLFTGMLALAMANRFWLVPRLVSQAKRGDAATGLRRLHRHVLAEQILALAIVLIVSVLGTIAPASSLSS